MIDCSFGDAAAVESAADAWVAARQSKLAYHDCPIEKPADRRCQRAFRNGVETTGIEPATPALQRRCSPN